MLTEKSSRNTRNSLIALTLQSTAANGITKIIKTTTHSKNWMWSRVWSERFRRTLILKKYCPRDMNDQEKPETF